MNTRAERKKALGNLLMAGRKMSNLCFNVAQMREFRADIPVTADECRKEWDAAMTRWNQSNLTPKDPDAVTGCADDAIDPAAVNKIREVIARSGLSNEEFARRFSELTPEQIAKYRKETR